MAETGPQKDRFTSLDTLALVREIRRLGRARLDKAFDDPELGGWILSFRVPGLGRQELRIVPGRYAALRPGGESPHSESPGPFARELRRLLTGAVVEQVAEPGGERYLELQFRRGDDPEPLVLAVELFGRGNVVVAHGATIAAVAHPRSWAQRTVRVGSEYQRPPARANPWTLGAAELAQALIASRTDRVSTLAARLALGGPVAEELLARAHLAPELPAAEDPGAAAEALAGALRTLLGEVGEAPVGHLYLREGVPLDVEPFDSVRFAHVPGLEATTYPTFSEAADRYFAAVHPVPAEPTAEDRQHDLNERTRRQQTEAIDRLGAEIELLRRQAEAILANYPEAEAALAAEPAAGEAGAAGRKSVLAGVEVTLHPDESPRQTAQALFEEMKRLQSKLRGAQGALEAAAQAPPPSPSGSARRSSARSAVRKPRFWFEAYRWFLTSEEVLVVGGRDAISNDRIVKRDLGAGDRYVHADLHGAPSVVIKHPAPGRPPAGESSLREACQFGLAFSKAWRAGRASGDAYWVEADQVSKAAASGEFVPRGAWIIHGTKHFYRDLPVELGIGTVRYEGEELVSVAPPEALRARGELRVLLEPGEERERAEREVELAELLGLTRSAIQPLLPAGGFRFRRA
jgi:predicted ribosome quality control (RQC) complex YloA/Tae2 family protein